MTFFALPSNIRDWPFLGDPVAFSHTPLSQPKEKASGLSRRRKAKAQEHLAFFLHESGVIPFLLQHGSNLIVIQLVFVSDEASPNPNHGPRPMSPKLSSPPLSLEIGSFLAEWTYFYLTQFFLWLVYWFVISTYLFRYYFMLLCHWNYP